jgi:hypothetical protein
MVEGRRVPSWPSTSMLATTAPKTAQIAARYFVQMISKKIAVTRY